MTTYQDILDKLRQSQLMQKFNANKQAMTNPQPSGFGHGIANLGMKMSQSQIPQIAKLGVGTQTLGNKLGALGAAKGLGSAGGALGNAGAMGGAAGALGKATPFLGGAMSGAQAAQDASRGDYIGAGLNGIAAGASFVPGVGTAVAMGAQALDSINKMFRSAKDKANQQAMQKSMQEAQNSEQANAESTEQLQNQFANDSMQYADAMAQPSTYDAMKTQLPVGQEVGYQVAKDNSPFANDSGYDYDLRGAYQRLGGLNPEATNGHLSDYDKLPIHPTFSTDSKFYNGQDYAINPETYSYPEEQEIGTPATATTPANNSLVNTIKNMFNRGMATGGAASVQPIQVMDDGNGGAVVDKAATNALANQYQEPKESLVQKIMNGLGQFKAGYDDNSTTGFADGDLANKLSGNAQQPVTAQNGTLTGGAAKTKKTLMNRIGEAAGTGRRLMANPWVQAGIAAAISKADGGDVGDMAQAAYKYGTAKAMSDQYYRQLHPDAKVMPVLNTYGVDDYKAKAYNDFNQGRTVMSRRDLIKLQNPTMSDQDIEDLITKSGINGDELVSIKGYESVERAKNNTRKTDIQEDKNKWQKDQGQQKIGIQQQNANTNAGRLTETQNHNRITEAQGAKRNEIAEKKLNNQNNNNKNTTTRTTSSGVKVEEGKVYKNAQGEEYVFMDGKWIKNKK